MAYGQYAYSKSSVSVLHHTWSKEGWKYVNDDATTEQPKTQITDANVNRVRIFGPLRSTIKSSTDNRIKYESKETVQQNPAEDLRKMMC